MKHMNKNTYKVHDEAQANVYTESTNVSVHGISFLFILIPHMFVVDHY
jgi:hypothetical protein